MKLIVDIDEDYFKIINKNGASNYPEEVIKNGIPIKDEVMLATLLSLVTDKDYKPKLEGEQE